MMILTTILAGALLGQQSGRPAGFDSAFEKARSTGWYTHYAGSAPWNPKTVIEFKGRVIGLIESAKSVDLMLKLENGGTAFVELGPKAYFDGQALHLSPKDSVRIKGSKVDANGESLILCQEIGHKGSKVAFRDQKGEPFWMKK